MLYGRDGEAAALRGLLDGARGGRSGALVLRGEAGIGKTALLEHAVGQAADMTVVRGSGVEFEAELPFAGLQLLLRTAMGADGALPEPQRRALRAAFGLGGVGPGPVEPMFVGLAVLSLLSEHAGAGPLLCVVDDAQWLDRASADALLFAARRLDAEGVAMVFAARDGEGAFPAPGLPELRPAPLDEAAALALLAERSGREEPMADGLRRRVMAEAQGNPLALLELPAGLRDADGAVAGPGALPLTSRLQLAFHGRVSHLPRATQTLLLVAAADHTGELGTVLRAADELGAGVADLPPAQDAGLVTVDGTLLRFRHPLVRAAIHQRAPLPERLAAHRALAAAADPERDADHRAWHLAAAATGPDETAAAALERTAGRARERSGHTAAAAAYDRAARLSTDPAARLRRLLLAAESASEAGEIPRARAFADEAARLATRLAADRSPARGNGARPGGAPDNGPGGAPGDSPGPARTGAPERDAARTAAARPPHGGGPRDGLPAALPAGGAEQLAVARTLHVRGLADFLEGDFPGAHRLLIEGAALAAEGDPQRAARMLVQATHTAWYLGGDEVAGTLARLDALRLPPDAPELPVADFLVAALGPRSAGRVPPDLGAAAAAARAAHGGRVDPGHLVMLCGVGLTLGQDVQAHELTTVLAAEGRESGGVGRLTTVLFFRAEAEIFDARFDDAAATAREALRIAADTGQRQWVSQLSSALAYVAAVRGDQDGCRRRVDAALAGGSGTAMAPGAPWAYWSQGLLELGLGRAQAALEQLALLGEESVRHHISATRSVPDLVEAAVRLGVPERADASFARFEAWAARSGQSWAAALVARCRALRAPEADAEAYYLAALDAHDPHRRAMESARTGLLYGEWLRRARRKSEARGRLRTALDVFERLGAAPWAERARGELGAAGGTLPESGRAAAPVDVEAGLTPQESQIVRLAAEGLSNKDIAARLFLSPRTVGYHLYKAYPKLGVASRGELAGLFG
ncbi:AAA family ATPase [Streptomyces sp. NRRL F-5123]|uniref:AAA family ATPase n=1 Tax=Streptomyces sp. NRRL F-5123 TaxID=1463856 RepID=UPI0005BE0504|nr:helix-turn-helix transcriptional regulator [Streptomyces sp. NRRL F-5123]